MAEASSIPAWTDLSRTLVSPSAPEGFNYKIKVDKRIGDGYRDDEYFFTLIRYLALPLAWIESHKFP